MVCLLRIIVQARTRSVCSIPGRLQAMSCAATSPHHHLRKSHQLRSGSESNPSTPSRNAYPLRHRDRSRRSAQVWDSPWRGDGILFRRFAHSSRHPERRACERICASFRERGSGPESKGSTPRRIIIVPLQTFVLGAALRSGTRRGEVTKLSYKIQTGVSSGEPTQSRAPLPSASRKRRGGRTGRSVAMSRKACVV